MVPVHSSLDGEEKVCWSFCPTVWGGVKSIVIPNVTVSRVFSVKGFLM